ncbi:hypothetical protein ACH5RR_039398 [Cinchona calisaya]|uniref:Aminotransferase-like plant mobile domain-containing protein n=1 Tax=Cinchona calisaya TaxID=153742 RepID=A0ABD2Y3B7_9GENT
MGGSLVDVKDWWQNLPRDVKLETERARFDVFLEGLPWVEAYPSLIYALAKKWWDTTNSFHFTIGDMTLTSTDFYYITGLRVGGISIPRSIERNDEVEYIRRLLGWVPENTYASDISVKDLWK